MNMHTYGVVGALIAVILIVAYALSQFSTHTPEEDFLTDENMPPEHVENVEEYTDRSEYGNDPLGGLAIGDVLAGFAVTEIDGRTVQMSGTTTVRGTYSQENLVIGPVFHTLERDRTKVPYIEGDAREGGSFCFTNSAYAHQLLSATEGTVVTISIRDFTIDLRQTETCDSTEIIDVMP